MKNCLFFFVSKQLGGAGAYMTRWKAVFFVACRDYGVHRNVYGVARDELQPTLPVDESQVLFLVDGLDELGHGGCRTAGSSASFGGSFFHSTHWFNP